MRASVAAAARAGQDEHDREQADREPDDEGGPWRSDGPGSTPGRSVGGGVRSAGGRTASGFAAAGVPQTSPMTVVARRSWTVIGAAALRVTSWSGRATLRGLAAPLADDLHHRVGRRLERDPCRVRGGSQGRTSTGRCRPGGRASCREPPVGGLFSAMTRRRRRAASRRVPSHPPATTVAAIGRQHGRVPVVPAMPTARARTSTDAAARDPSRTPTRALPGVPAARGTSGAGRQDRSARTSVSIGRLPYRPPRAGVARVAPVRGLSAAAKQPAGVRALECGQPVVDSRSARGTRGPPRGPGTIRRATRRTAILDGPSHETSRSPGGRRCRCVPIPRTSR